MTEKQKAIWLPLLICIISGPTQAQEKPFDPVPQNAYLATIRTDCSPEDAMVAVKRDHSGFKGSGVHSILKVDGKDIAEIQRGQLMRLCLDAGEHIIGVSWSILGGLAANRREVAAELKAGRSYSFRIFVLHGNGATIEPSSN